MSLEARRRAAGHGEREEYGDPWLMTRVYKVRAKLIGCDLVNRTMEFKIHGSYCIPLDFLNTRLNQGLHPFTKTFFVEVSERLAAEYRLGSVLSPTRQKFITFLFRMHYGLPDVNPTLGDSAIKLFIAQA